MKNKIFLITFFIIIIFSNKAMQNRGIIKECIATGASSTIHKAFLYNGFKDASPFYQAINDIACEKMGIKKKITVKRMNATTEKEVGFTSMFIMPFLNTIWINEELLKSDPEYIVGYKFFHEIAHMILQHHKKRELEASSGTVLGVIGAINLLAARFPVFSLPYKVRFVQLGMLTTFGALSKCMLDQTNWYKDILQKWFKEQENEAHALALEYHDNPKQVVEYYKQMAAQKI